MVSLWPWKERDSAASFEKTLSTLSAKISKTTTSRNGLKSRSRRLKALWTLYTAFAYILCVLILTLVTGWRNWGLPEYAAILGSPILIYTIRLILAYYYNYRIASTESYLDSLNAQRDEAIEKFKAATKYNTTQQLLEKYGAAPPTPPAPSKSQDKKSPKSSKDSPKAPQVQRTGLPPPPTANIPRPVADSRSSGPGHGVPSFGQSPNAPQQIPGMQAPAVNPGRSPMSPGFGEEFAENAYNAVPQFAEQGGGAWYDRIVDLLMGEDETRAINRTALICQSCRLVNGQAPPGMKTPEEIGRWRCMNCRAWNGIDTSSPDAILRVTAADTDAAQDGAKPETPSELSKQDEKPESVNPTAGDENPDVLDEEGDNEQDESPPETQELDAEPPVTRSQAQAVRRRRGQAA